ncbi:MAG: threonine ammonia-lyase, biosynthetic, partial [Gammaproteobacteria bacterium]
IVGVEPVDADAMTQSLAAGKRIELPQVGLFADGVAVRLVGEETFALAQRHVDRMVRVDTDAICAAIKDVFEDTRSILEPAGALAVAGMKEDVAQRSLKDQTLVAVACGANMNFDRLRYVAERAELGEQREALLAVTIAEKPGSFLEFCNTIGNRPITEFNYRYSDQNCAHVFAGIQLKRGGEERQEIINELRSRDYPVLDMTDDEMAKVHIRHMVGGRAQGLENEVLYRFEFPERPRALLNFLTHMAAGWNISLFHYRNQGGDFGRVLVGIQVPPSERAGFKDFLKELAYPYTDESDNAAYKLFL